MKKLIAKCFISVSDLDEMGLEIPKDTTIVNAQGQETGTYLKHVTDSGLNYHIISRPGFQSTPFDTQDNGIIIECPFDMGLIRTKLGTQIKPTFTKKIPA